MLPFPQAALSCLLYERDQAQARVAELEEKLKEAHGSIRDGFAEVDASRAGYNGNGKASLDAETRQSGAVPVSMTSDVKAENSSCSKMREGRRNDARSLRTRYVGGEFGAVGPVRGAAPRPQGIRMANNVSVDLGNRSSTDRVEDERFMDCRVLPLTGSDSRVGDADDVSATVNHRGPTGGNVRDENATFLRLGEVEARLEGLKESIPKEEEDAGIQVA